MPRQMLILTGLEDHGNAITANLLSKSGLSRNRVLRDLNILEGSVNEAARHLWEDDLSNDLDKHFGLDNLNDDKRKSQADGCTISALLMMNAAMLHQRIAVGRWISNVSDLVEVKNEVKVVRRVRREWERILRHDFRPVLEPAVSAIEAVEDTGKLAGLERALRHITAEAERIAGNLRRHGCRPCRAAVQSGDAQSSIRRRIFHSTGGRLHRRPSHSGRLWRCELVRLGRLEGSQDH